MRVFFTVCFPVMTGWIGTPCSIVNSWACFNSSGTSVAYWLGDSANICANCSCIGPYSGFTTYWTIGSSSSYSSSSNLQPVWTITVPSSTAVRTYSSIKETLSIFVLIWLFNRIWFCLAASLSSQEIGLTLNKSSVLKKGSDKAAYRHSACLRISLGTILELPSGVFTLAFPVTFKLSSQASTLVTWLVWIGRASDRSCFSSNRVGGFFQSLRLTAGVSVFVVFSSIGC